MFRNDPNGIVPAKLKAVSHHGIPTKHTRLADSEFTATRDEWEYLEWVRDSQPNAHFSHVL